MEVIPGRGYCTRLLGSSMSLYLNLFQILSRFFKYFLKTSLCPYSIQKIGENHSMARANLNKSKKVLTSTTTGSKYIPKRPRISINWNPLFQTQIYLVKVPLNVNIVKQFFENFMKWGLKAVVVEVKTFLLLFRLALAILWATMYLCSK